MVNLPQAFLEKGVLLGPAPGTSNVSVWDSGMMLNHGLLNNDNSEYDGAKQDHFNYIQKKNRTAVSLAVQYIRVPNMKP